MKVYQDLEALGNDERARMEFVQDLVKSHVSSDAYKIAEVAEKYYSKRNPTIEAFQKVLYTAKGEAYRDLFSSNFKLKTLFFRRFVIQQVQYVLSNGVTFEQSTAKERLGASFDNQLQKLAKKAMVDGVSYGFWNKDHLEVFSLVPTGTDVGFAPLYDGTTGELAAGVRFWANQESETKRYTLYEADGVTEYIKPNGEDIRVWQEKRPYIQRIRTDGIGSHDVEGGENYAALPIIPMYANDLRQSEIIGIRENIDCYDFIKSGLANVIEDNSSVYWTLRNAGGMNDADIARFMDRLRTLRAAAVDADAEGGVDAHTLDIPYEAREAMLSRLRCDLYEDFQLVDMEKMVNGNITATAIRAGYQNQDDKSGDFEYCIREFIDRLLSLLGIEGEPSFQWNRIANQLEETQMVLAAANYLDDEAVINHLPWLTPEEKVALLKRRAAEELRMIEEVPEDGET